MKVHVRKGSGNGCDDIPLCAFNNSRQYNHLPSDFVKSAKDFRMAMPEDRCSHCMDKYLIERNRQRREKALPPVESAFEGQTCYEHPE